MFEIPQLTLAQKILLRIFGNVNVGPRIEEGWKEPIDHYVFECDKHGLVIDMVRGNGSFRCPSCQKEVKNSV